MYGLRCQNYAIPCSGKAVFTFCTFDPGKSNLLTRKANLCLLLWPTITCLINFCYDWRTPPPLLYTTSRLLARLIRKVQQLSVRLLNLIIHRPGELGCRIDALFQDGRMRDCTARTWHTYICVCICG